MNLEPRTQFTFFRSYYEAISTLKPRARLACYDAVARYALDGETPELQGSAATVFILIKPILDKGRARAEAGALGGSKTKANGKQTASDKEKEKERNIHSHKEWEKEGGAFRHKPPAPYISSDEELLRQRRAEWKQVLDELKANGPKSPTA